MRAVLAYPPIQREREKECSLFRERHWCPLQGGDGRRVCSGFPTASPLAAKQLHWLKRAESARWSSPAVCLARWVPATGHQKRFMSGCSTDGCAQDPLFKTERGEKKNQSVANSEKLWRFSWQVDFTNLNYKLQRLRRTRGVLKKFTEFKKIWFI